MSGRHLGSHVLPDGLVRLELSAPEHQVWYCTCHVPHSIILGNTVDHLILLISLIRHLVGPLVHIDVCQTSTRHPISRTYLASNLVELLVSFTTVEIRGSEVPDACDPVLKH